MQYSVRVSYEAVRGCGYRRAGKQGFGLYFVGGAYSEVCERLPFPLSVCPVCSQGIKFTRGFSWINPVKLLDREPRCFGSGQHAHERCPLCLPTLAGERAGLLWVGDKFYSPQSFLGEASRLGVSKRVAFIPRGFQFGQTWIYLAHNKAVPKNEEYYEQADRPLAVNGTTALPETLPPTMVRKWRLVHHPGIFSAFKPRKVEIVVNSQTEVPDGAKRLMDTYGDRAELLVVRKLEEQILEKELV